VFDASEPLSDIEDLSDIVVGVVDHRQPHVVPGRPPPVRLRPVDGDADDLEVQCRELIEQAVELNGCDRSGTPGGDEPVAELIDEAALGGEPEDGALARRTEIKGPAVV
jgi:hypothetical protein